MSPSVVDQVVHEDRPRVSDLVGGQAGSVSCGVGLVEVIDEGGEFAVERGDRHRWCGQSGVSGNEDRSNSHTTESTQI